MNYSQIRNIGLSTALLFTISITTAFSQSSNSYIESQSIISIEDARSVQLGTTVRITGWVTVANELGGPVFLQDETAGIAVFHNPLHTAVEIGDSIVVEGPISEFGNTPGSTGNGLRQISGTGITFSVYAGSKKIQQPVQITVNMMNSGQFEGQLVSIENILISTLNSSNRFTGSFQSGTNYRITDQSGIGELRIDASSTLIGSSAPDENIKLTGVVGRFRGTYQIFPRFASDLEQEEFVQPGSDLSRNQTFDIATWNIQLFGSTENGPSNRDLQFENVRTVIETMELDVYALQEISDEAFFFRLVDSLANYNGLIANYTQTQRVAYLYNIKSVNSLATAFVAEGSSWAGGRFPYMMLIDATVLDETKRIRVINFHAKAFSSQSDYNQRVNDAIALKNYTDSRVTQDNLIILGDYNDRINSSTYASATSPYKIFLDDQNYTIVTKPLEDAGRTSFRSSSMIDHITINANMAEFHIDGAEQIENPTYITNYLNTTSDHYPVFTRFQFSEPVSIAQPSETLPTNITLSQNYPNPFNPTTTIQFELPSADVISLAVYDVTGRLISTLSNNQSYSAGAHQLTFDASALSSGLYIYHLQSSSGVNITQKMMLIK
jgi:endonuclease/exonuclease/phosphatase family metal-dependent hydrolase